MDLKRFISKLRIQEKLQTTESLRSLRSLRSLNKLGQFQSISSRFQVDFKFAQFSPQDQVFNCLNISFRLKRNRVFGQKEIYYQRNLVWGTEISIQTESSYWTKF